MDSQFIIEDFRQNISARNMFYLLGTGCGADPDFVKLLRCAMIYHGVKIVDLEKELGVNRTTLKRMLMSLGGCVRGTTRFYVFARIIRRIEVLERAPVLSSGPRWKRRVRPAYPEANRLAMHGAA